MRIASLDPFPPESWLKPEIKPFHPSSCLKLLVQTENSPNCLLRDGELTHLKSDLQCVALKVPVILILLHGRTLFFFLLPHVQFNRKTLYFSVL